MKPGFVRSGLITVLLLFPFCGGTAAQDPGPPENESGAGAYSIRWMASMPADENKTGSSLGSRLSRLLIGHPEIKVVRPVSVSVNSDKKIWIADQGAGRIFSLQESGAVPLRVRRSQYESFPSLVGTCILPGNRLAFTDSQLNAIFLYDPQDRSINSLNDSLLLDGPTGIAFSEKKYSIPTPGSAPCANSRIRT